MRIAVVNWSGRRVGGTETYLSLIIPQLARAGSDVAFFHESDEPSNRERIELPEGVPSWCVKEAGEARALEALREWRPDLIYTHSLSSPSFEAETLKIAPAVFFAHAYYGTCISGAKSFKLPTFQPCARRFGPACLLQYFPRRCGGLSPLTMMRLYALQSKRLKLLHRYEAVLTHSAHMKDEYLKHGLAPERVHNLSYYAHASGGARETDTETETETRTTRAALRDDEASSDARRSERDSYRLLYVGRMETLKGGRVLIEALPRIASKLSRPVRLTLAGDGPDRKAWEERARLAQEAHENVRVDFKGWLSRRELDALYNDCDLLVFPSLWPEPFGLAGPEAGLRSVPVAAFDVGGVSEWLEEGVNGHLAPGDPPTSEGIAEAVVRCLADPEKHARLRRGAFETAQRFSLKNHMQALLEVFERVVARRREAASYADEMRAASVL